MKTLKLFKPIKNIHDDEISEIQIKKITGTMYLKYGDLEQPEMYTDGKSESMVIKTNLRALRGYLSECTGLPDSTIGKMGVKDIQAAQGVLQGFLVGL